MLKELRETPAPEVVSSRKGGRPIGRAAALDRLEAIVDAAELLFGGSDS